MTLFYILLGVISAIGLLSVGMALWAAWTLLTNPFLDSRN